MQPVTQIITRPNAENLPGDCFRAAVASVMELPLDGVPHFMLFGDKWLDAFFMWMEERGFSVSFTTDAFDVPTDTFYLLTGKSPRGDFKHTVVARNSETLHDPHPMGGGVESFVHAIWVVRREH